MENTTARKDEPLVVTQTLSVRGVFLDTQAWRARYQQARHDVVAVLRQLPGFLETFRQLAPTALYRIEWSPEMVTALREGHAHWKRNKEGFLSVVLRKPGGEILKHLSLERVTPVQFAPLVQLATQSMLAEIIERLETIDQKASAILRGQVTDRIGTLIGAENQFREAMTATGEDKRALLRQSAGLLNKARGNALAYIQSALPRLNLDTAGWGRFLQYVSWRRPQGARLREQIQEVHQHLRLAIRATRYLEEVYEELQQPAAANEALSIFSMAMESVLVRGRQAARWLPYDREDPPEELWDYTQRMLEGPIRQGQHLLTGPSQTVALEIDADDILSPEQDDAHMSRNT